MVSEVISQHNVRIFRLSGFRLVGGVTDGGRVIGEMRWKENGAGEEFFVGFQVRDG